MSWSKKASEAPPTKRGKYKAWTTKDLAEIGKYVNDHGNAATIHHFPTRHPVLKRQTVDTFKQLYQKAKQKSHNKEVRIVFMNLTLHFFSKMHTCRLLRLNLGVQEEHLTSQLSWVTTWLLDARACPAHLVDEYLVLVFYTP